MGSDDERPKKIIIPLMNIMQKTNNTVFLSAGLIVLLIFPVFLFLFRLSKWRLPASSEWFNVFLSTLTQAGLSAGFCIFFGVLGFLGLRALSENSISRWGFGRNPLGFNIPALELFCLLPAVLPPLVPALSWINVWEMFFSQSVFSFSSVVAVHVLMNTGLVSVFFCRLFREGAEGLSAYAFLHGASRFRFLSKMLFFEWRKDLILIFLLVFSFCFTSFSVPMLVGGMSGRTLELFIAEKLKDPAFHPEAMTLFAFQTIFLFLFFSFFYGNARSLSKTPGRNKKLYLVSCFPFVLIPLLPSLLVFLGLLLPVSPAVYQELFSIKTAVFSALARTLLMGSLTGLLTLFLLSALAFCLRDLFLRRFLLAYCGSSTAFMGFAFLLIGPDSYLMVLLKWSLGLSLLFLPALYRLMGESLLRRLKNQVYAADLMGAGRFKVFTDIVWPQSAGAFFFLAGLAAFWASGDFAYSSIVAGDEGHLALLIQELFALYRFELATLLTVLLILSAGLCFFLFAGSRAFFFRGKYSLPPG